MNLNQRFDKLDDNLKLDPNQRERAQELHRQIGDRLVAAGVATRTRLQGSFARKTMLPPLHDVDKVIEMHSDHWDSFRGPDGPVRAMALIQETLRPHLPGASYQVKKHTLAITLAGEEFSFDAVPAFPGDEPGWILIANTETGAWEPSNTYQLIDTVAARNLACAGRFVHQVRMAKQVVAHAGLAADLPGLHTESFTFEAVTGVMAHAEAVAAALAMGAKLLGGVYFEPTGVDPISNRLEPWEVARAQTGLVSLAQRADEALTLAAAGDENGAAAIWAELFGDSFPRPSADEAGFLAGLWAGGTVGAAADRAVPRTRAWRPE